jgi:small-conductance mechanosensitive channel
MQEILIALSEVKADIPWRNILLGLVILFLGQILLRLVDWVLRSLFKQIKERQNVHNFRKFSIYTYNIILFIFFLKILKVDMKVVLGAAGFLTLAVGFAARTPISNLISGMFLVFERPFVVGDVIEVNEYRGEVVSLNLLSLTLRTLDNLMVRIPNEMVIGVAVRNISFFPIRRLELKYVISNRESLSRLEEIFMDVATRNELALDEPEPYFSVTEFLENSVHVSFLVWSSSVDFLKFQSEFPKEIHRAVKKSGMEYVRSEIELFQSPKNKHDA